MKSCQDFNMAAGSRFSLFLLCVVFFLLVALSGCTLEGMAEEQIEIGTIEISYPSNCEIRPKNPERHVVESVDGDMLEVESVRISEEGHMFSIKASVLYGVSFEEVSQYANDLAEGSDAADKEQKGFDNRKWKIDPQSLPSDIEYEKPKAIELAGSHAISQRWSWFLDGREYRGAARYVQLDGDSVAALTLLCDLQDVDQGFDTFERISSSIRR